MKQLLKCGYILAGEDFHEIKDGYVAIENDIIVYVGKDKPESDFDVIHDFKDSIIIPGLYNLHTHSPMTLLRGLGSDLSLDKWLNDVIFPMEAQFSSEHIQVGSQIAIMEMIACGTVSFSDMYDMSNVTAREVIKSGMKANIGSAITGFNINEKYEDNVSVKNSLDFYKEYNNKNENIIVDFSVHAEYTSFDSLVRRYAQDCKRVGARMHIHLSETEKELEACKIRHNGKTPVRWFHDLGVFDNPTIAAHCVVLEDEDIDILKMKNVSCIHNPTSNMKLGSGFMPIQKLLDIGINVGIGTDGCASNNNLNMIEEMHLASIIHNGYTNNPTIVKAIDILKMATKNGALAQGRSNSGEISSGFKADIVAINMKAPHMIPTHDPCALVAYSAQGSDVIMTMVNGKILYKNGEYLTIDSERVYYELKGVRNKLFGY